VSDAYKLGLDHIRAGRYFEAHEELELVWRAAPQEERDFYQGLVHVAVAWYQDGRGRPVATERQLEKALRRLAAYEPEHRGVDVARLRAQLTELLAGSPPDLRGRQPDGI
jgi:predicted metal-dependent hydrolase